MTEEAEAQGGQRVATSSQSVGEASQPLNPPQVGSRGPRETSGTSLHRVRAENGAQAGSGPVGQRGAVAGPAAPVPQAPRAPSWSWTTGQAQGSRAHGEPGALPGKTVVRSLAFWCSGPI